MPLVYFLRPIEHHVRRNLASESDRRRFDRAKQFVDKNGGRRRGDAAAHRVHARWLRFLCSQASVQRDVWPKEVEFLRHFATVFGLSSAATRKFVNLSLLGRLWRAWCFEDLRVGRPNSSRDSREWRDGSISTDAGETRRD